MVTPNDVRHKWLGCTLSAGVKRFAPLVDVLVSFCCVPGRAAFGHAGAKSESKSLPRVGHPGLHALRR